MLLLNPTKDDMASFLIKGVRRPPLYELGTDQMGSLKKRSINLAGHATSLALEPEFWAVLQSAAVADSLSIAGLIQRIDAGRGERPLASACRVFALLHGRTT